MIAYPLFDELWLQPDAISAQTVFDSSDTRRPSGILMLSFIAANFIPLTQELLAGAAEDCWRLPRDC